MKNKDNIIRAQIIKEYFLVIAGSLILALGIYFFKFPNHFSFGGISGISMILADYFGFSSAGTLVLVINTVLLVIGFACLGKECGLKTIVGSATLSITLVVLERTVPLGAPLTDQPTLELFYGVLLPAIGSAVVFNVGGSTGGTDITALLLKKYTSLDIGTALLSTDIIITFGAFVFGAKAGLYSVLGLLLKSVLVDKVIESINECKCFEIITDNPEEISDYIIKQLHHSTTVIEATGGYTHLHKYVIISTMQRRNAVQLRRFIKAN